MTGNPQVSGSGLGKELLDVPMGEMIKTMGLAIAEAQYELDQNRLRIMQMMSGEKYYITVQKPDGTTGEQEVPGFKVRFGPNKEELSLLELGFTPTFYQFVDTIIEVKISISMSQQNSSMNASAQVEARASGKLGFMSAKASASVSMVSAAYSSKFQYSAEGSSLLRTKLVPVPPPAILEQRIRRLIDK